MELLIGLFVGSIVASILAVVGVAKQWIVVTYIFALLSKLLWVSCGIYIVYMLLEKFVFSA